MRSTNFAAPVIFGQTRGVFGWLSIQQCDEECFEASATVSLEYYNSYHLSKKFGLTWIGLAMNDQKSKSQYRVL